MRTNFQTLKCHDEEPKPKRRLLKKLFVDSDDKRLSDNVKLLKNLKQRIEEAKNSIVNSDSDESSEKKAKALAKSQPQQQNQIDC